MDAEVERERDIAIVQPFVLGCTALARLLGRGFNSVARVTSQRYVFACWHEGREGNPMDTAAAVQFLTRDSAEGRKRAVDSDAAFAMGEVLSDELLAGCNDETALVTLPEFERDLVRHVGATLTTNDFRDQVRTELGVALKEQRSHAASVMSLFLDAEAGGSNQTLHDAFVGCVRFMPVFPPAFGFTSTDVLFTMLGRLLERRADVIEQLSASSAADLAREFRRIGNMRKPLAEMVGREAEPCRQLRSIHASLLGLDSALGRRFRPVAGAVANTP